MHGHVHAEHARCTKPNAFLAVRLPADGAAVRALGPVRRARAAPGALADRRLAVPGRVRRADLRRRQRRTLLQLLPLLRLARLRAASTSSLAARGLRVAHRRCCCAPPATGAARCSSARGKHIGDVAHALADAPHSPIEVVGFLSPSALPANGLRSLGSLGDLEQVLGDERDRRGDHRRPRLPAGRRRRARRPVPPARRARAARAVDDGDPDPPRRVRAGPVGAAVRARAAGLRGRRLRAQAHLRHRRRDAAADRCSARCCWRSRSPCGSPRAGRSCSARCAAASASGRSRA